MTTVAYYARIFSKKVPPARVRAASVTNTEQSRTLVPIRAADRTARGVSFGNVKTKYMSLVDIAKLFGLDKMSVRLWYDQGILPAPFMLIPRKCHGKAVDYPVYLIGQARAIVAALNSIYAAGYKKISTVSHHDVLSALHELSDKEAARMLKKIKDKNNVHGLNELQIKWYNRRG